MSSEQITKFQPNRTLYLRGFDGAGAAAALHNTNATGFSVSGVYRDMADFCVLVIYDADNIFEHYSVRYLPDFNLTGMVLSFDVSYQGLQCLDSAKSSWIDWANLDAVTSTGVTNIQPVLWDYATLVSGSYTTAQGTFTFSTGSAAGCTEYDRVTLFINDTAFDFIANGGETADYVANYFATYINGFTWATFANTSVSVIAETASGGQLIIKYGRTGYVNVDGVNVTFVPSGGGIKFPGLASGSTIYINATATANPNAPYTATAYTIDEVTSPTTLTLTSAAATLTNVCYLAEFGGNDGNGLTVYILQRTGNTLQVDKTALPLTGGNSDNVTWNITLDFSALHLASVRQMWFTLAPQLPTYSAYSATEFTATFSNWKVTDPNNIGTLQIAGPNSVRVGNADTACVYSPDGWSVQSANNYWHGFARSTIVAGASVSITYSCSESHDLYLGTSLYTARGAVSISVDNNPAITIDCYLAVSTELVARRRIGTASLNAGLHTVVITLTSTPNALSGYNYFVFDYLEAAVPTPDIPDPSITYPNISPALDYDTDATYKMSPQRILWHLAKLGFQGHMNEYLGVFWWNQRVSANAVINTLVVTFAGTFAANDSAEIIFGVSPFTFKIGKVVTPLDSLETIANHFVYYINSSAVAVWAHYNNDAASPGQMTISIRTPDWNLQVAAATTSTSGTVALSYPGRDNLTPDTWITDGTPGIWQVDPTAANPLNFAIRQWHADLFSELQAAGNLITTSFSMELVYPPDYTLESSQITVDNAWSARFYDGSPVSTDTGFASLVSSQCAFISNMTNFQQQVFVAMADLQSAAGLTPWLQFGEFLWWFFSSKSFAIGSVTASNNSLVIETGQYTGVHPVFGALPHGMATGDRVVITGVTGCTAANGTWTITRLTDTTISIPATANGSWTNSSGAIRGGSMAYYDPVTTAAAQSALGQALFKFTCQDDDPSVNNGADASFLAARLKLHVDTIRSGVLAQFPNAKFEILYPNDVNNPVCLVGPGVAYPQGGRLNAAVNLPTQWHTQAGSGLDSFKVEALSWSATYLEMNLAQQAIVFALTPPLSWDTSQVAYLVPWFNGTCPWPREFLSAFSRGIKILNFWAYDHLALMSWPIPLPISLERSRFLG